MSTALATRLLSRQTGTLPILSRSNRKKATWPDPDLSLGPYIGKFGREHCWEAKGPAREVFKQLAPKIKAYLDNSLEPIGTWVTWHIYMFGKAAESTAPTVLFCSENATRRKEIRDVVKGSGLLEQHPGVKTAHMPKPPEFGQNHRLVQLGSRSAQIPGNFDTTPVAFAYKAEDPQGLQIFIRGCTRGEWWARKATIGGVIQLGSNFYYTTAAHAFQPPSSPSISDGSTTLGKDDFEIDSDSEFEDDETYFDQNTQDSEGLLYFPGNSLVPRTDGEHCTVELEPGADKSVDRTASADIEPESWLASESSHSNLKTLTKGIRSGLYAFMGSATYPSQEEPTNDLDFTMLVVENPDHQTPNKIPSKAAQVMTCSGIISTEPQDDSVLCMTSRGPVTGRISGTPLYACSAGSRSSRYMLKVQLDAPLELGDSGSWIVSSNTGDVYGHLVAGSPGSCTGLIVPFADIWIDLQKRTREAPLMPTQKRKTDFTGFTGAMLPHAVPDGTGPITADEFTKSWTRELTSKLRVRMREKHLRRLQDMIKISKEFNQKPQALKHKTGEDDAVSLDNDSLPPEFLAISDRVLPVLPTPPLPGDKEWLRFQSLLARLSSIPMEWENPGLLDEALGKLDLERIYTEAEEKAFEFEAQALSVSPDTKPKWAFQDCLIRSLMRFFKRNFFLWVDNPLCSKCISPTIAQGLASPTALESASGATKVENYKCSNPECDAYERFPRYRDVWILMQTRRGRVGEWNNCFGMLCRAIGSRVRWIWTAEDHVWVEVYSEHQRRWVHADPCEESWDNPQLYTKGWGKQMSYCIAFSNEGAKDVTRRYVRDSLLSLPRNKCPEPVLRYFLDDITRQRRSSLDFSEEDVARLKKEDEKEEYELRSVIVSAITRKLAAVEIASLGGDTEGKIHKRPGVVGKKDTGGKRVDRKKVANSPKNAERAECIRARQAGTGGSSAG